MSNFRKIFESKFKDAECHLLRCINDIEGGFEFRKGKTYTLYQDAKGKYTRDDQAMILRMSNFDFAKFNFQLDSEPLHFNYEIKTVYKCL